MRLLVLATAPAWTWVVPADPSEFSEFDEEESIAIGDLVKLGEPLIPDQQWRQQRDSVKADRPGIVNK